MKKLLLPIVACLMATTAARAGAFIDPSDYGEGGDWRTVVLSAGLFAEITCRQHKRLIAVGVTETAQGFARWLFRIALMLLLGQLVSRMLGLYWYMAGPGFALLGAWAALRSAQALYLSGCDRFMQDGDRIKQKLADHESQA